MNTYLIESPTAGSRADKCLSSLIPLVLVSVDVVEIHQLLDELPVIINEVSKSSRKCEDHLLIRPCIGGVSDFQLDVLQCIG